MICEKCEKDVEKLSPMLYQNGDKLMICSECWGYEEMRADMIYERQREEGEV